MPKEIILKDSKPKLKLKKNANDPVNFDLEKKLDPKYKTELCKSWCENNFCVYGNKCRFAHGKNELSSKQINAQKYKQKDCKSFKENGMCVYGNRCNFKHDERKLNQVERSYFTYLMKINKPGNRRLAVFKDLSDQRCYSNVNTELIQDDSTYLKIWNFTNYLFYKLSIVFNSEGEDIGKMNQDKICYKIPTCYYEYLMPNCVKFQTLASSCY